MIMSSKSIVRIELSTKKEKTRKILEENLKSMIMQKCTEIWAVYDEVQDELKATMTGF